MSDNESRPKKRQGERNPAASLQQKLRNYARAAGDDVALVLARYVNERFLYRLSLSPYRDRFILRGATLFTVWDTAPHRATRDIDLLATGDSSPEALRSILEAICAQPVEEDGMVFLPETLNIEERTERRIYQGLHLEMEATLSTARLRLEIDIAFGEAVSPPPQEVELPSLLGKPPARLRAYRRETAIAEKCQALVSLGMINTRMKDFYDLWYLSRACSFEGAEIYEALLATFTRRQTEFPAGGLPPALTDEFADDAIKRRQWSAFLGKTRCAEELPSWLPSSAISGPSYSRRCRHSQKIAGLVCTGRRKTVGALPHRTKGKRRLRYSRQAFRSSCSPADGKSLIARLIVACCPGLYSSLSGVIGRSRIRRPVA